MVVRLLDAPLHGVAAIAVATVVGFAGASTPLQVPPGDGTSTPARSTSPAADDAAELDAVLSERPVELEGIGVSLRVPKGAVVKALPNQTAYRIDDGQSPPRFLIMAQPMVASAATSTPQKQFDQHLQFLIEKGSEFSVIRDENLSFAGSPAKLAYLAKPMGDGVTAITGWLLIQTGPNTFVVFSIISSGVDFPQVDGILAMSYSTITMKALENVTSAQAEKLDRTRRFIDTLTPAKLRAMADGKPKWFRLYRPGGAQDGSDLEVGFLRITAFDGERGEVSASSAKGEKTPSEFGLIVEVSAKFLVHGDPAHSVDLQSRSWQAWDRQEECWSTVSTERAAKEAKTWGQTGWRSRPMSTNERGSILTVTSSDNQIGSMEWEIPAEGYLNQGEVVLLGSLLPREKSFEGDYSFYCYDNRTNKLPQRIDRWTRDTDGNGRYTLISRPSADAPEMKQVFSANGQRVQRIDADGLVTEAIEHADLLRLWKTKGLPTE